MVQEAVAINFSTEVVKSIIDCLPKPQSEGCVQLLPQILDEWARIDLRKHLSRESPATMRALTKTVKRIQNRAGQLLGELKAIDSRTLAGVMVEAEGGWSNVSRADFEHRVARLNEEQEFLRKLAATPPPAFWQRDRGQPRNVIAYLVLLDAAAIFEWFTGRKAARGVDRVRRTSSGPFFRFVSVLWPIIFPKKAPSLPTALKNWAHARSRYRERSPLLSNMNMRHPTWRIFER